MRVPRHGEGKWKTGGERFWMLESFTDADWSANKKHRKSTSSAIHFINGSFAHASARTQRVVSLSSAESELHSMVSGCSDGIYLRRCLQFLVNETVEQVQWTDNSAARQLVCRQGVGRIRHLSGKLLRVQGLVLEKEISVGQVPTEWIYSDIGTKPLNRTRMLMLLNQIRAIDPITMRMVGQEEFEAVSERMLSQQNLKKITKAILRMTALLGLESVISTGAEAAEISGFGDFGETCELAVQSANDSSESFWLWVFISCMVLLLVFRTLKKLSRDMEDCWKQAADEDEFSGRLEQRISGLDRRIEFAEGLADRNRAELHEEIPQVSNEVNMTHDYTSGFHYYIVEIGGYLKNGLELSHQQWTHLVTLERANLIASRTMGTVEYMRLIRQRGNPIGHADITDVTDANAEASESATSDNDMEIEPGTASSPTAGRPGVPQTVSEMVDLLKDEHEICLENGYYWDASAIQNLILEFLQVVRDGITEVLVARCKAKIHEVFTELNTNARRANRPNAEQRCQRISDMYPV